MSESEIKGMVGLLLKQQSQIQSEITELKNNMILLVRLDEKMVSQQHGLQRIGGQVDGQQKMLGLALDRLQRLETKESLRGGIVTWLVGILASIVTGIVMWFTKK